jgi:hypothetical protein
MGVQTLKNVVILATAVVAAVVLFQGAGPSVTAAPSRASVNIVASAPSAHSAHSELSAFLSGTSVPAAVAPATTTSTTATTPAAAAPSSAPVVSVSATDASAAVAGRTFTTTPAAVTVAPAAPTCPTAVSGSTPGAPGASDAEGVPGTTTADLNSFASAFNAIRVANCLTPIPFGNIRYSTCLQQRMWWMADDPSTDPASAWGHTGTAVRSDGVPIVGCDGDIAGGSGDTATSVANDWWVSLDHRASLYQPTFSGNVASVCIAFAISHGGINVPLPNEPYSFTRAAAYWYSC